MCAYSSSKADKQRKQNRATGWRQTTQKTPKFERNRKHDPLGGGREAEIMEDLRLYSVITQTLPNLSHDDQAWAMARSTKRAAPSTETPPLAPPGELSPVFASPPVQFNLRVPPPDQGGPLGNRFEGRPQGHRHGPPLDGQGQQRGRQGHQGYRRCVEDEVVVLPEIEQPALTSGG